MQRTLDAAITCLESAFKACPTISNSEAYRSKEITMSMLNFVNIQAQAEKNNEFLKRNDIVHCTVNSVSQSFVNVSLKTDDKRNFGSIHISKFSPSYIDNLADVVSIGEIFQAKIIGEFDMQWGWELSRLY